MTDEHGNFALMCQACGKPHQSIYRGRCPACRESRESAAMDRLVFERNEPSGGYHGPLAANANEELELRRAKGI